MKFFLLEMTVCAVETPHSEAMREIQKLAEMLTFLLFWRGSQSIFYFYRRGWLEEKYTLFNISNKKKEVTARNTMQK